MGGVVTITSQATLKKIAFQRTSVLQDVVDVAESMRPEDAAELYAVSGDTPKGGLLYCYLRSKPCMTMVSRHGYVMGMYGVIPEREGVGRIWMLGRNEMTTDKLDKITFLRQARIELDKLHNKYPLLFNVIDARNQVHIDWIRWMGFTIIKRHPQLGMEARPFYEFVRI
tara:strand:+ start:2838 stop:3344 length:507 start_codon:yes stop_codon:yes gene_type:complete